MTKREFKEAMMRGLGRCILELDETEDAEKYREIVLWGCTHNLSYDTQCEGTRAWYLRELIRRFSEEKPFVDAVARKLSEICRRLLHFGESMRNCSGYCEEGKSPEKTGCFLSAMILRLSV